MKIQMSEKKEMPGMMPKPSDQGKANTCTKHAVGKGVTGGLQVATWGTKVDVDQDKVTEVLVSTGDRKDVGGCWPTLFNGATILVSDRFAKEYYNIDISVTKCKLSTLKQNFEKSKFVVVYNTKWGPHCIYVNKFANGKLCCINSTGKRDQFPQLKPENTTAIYKIDATVQKSSLLPQGPKTSIQDKLDAAEAKVVEAEAEAAKAKAEAKSESEAKAEAEAKAAKAEAKASEAEAKAVKAEAMAAKAVSKVAKLEKRIEDMGKSVTDTVTQKTTELKNRWGKMTSLFGNGIKNQCERVSSYVEKRKQQ